MIDYSYSIGSRQKMGDADMTEIRLGLVEARFADIVWKHAPLTTRDLVTLCEEELNWKRTTTYTVLKKMCDRGIFTLCSISASNLKQASVFPAAVF